MEIFYNFGGAFLFGICAIIMLGLSCILFSESGWNRDRKRNFFILSLAPLFIYLAFFCADKIEELNSRYKLKIIKPTTDVRLGSFRTLEECKEAIDTISTTENNKVVTYTASDEEEHYVNSYVFICVKGW